MRKAGKPAGSPFFATFYLFFSMLGSSDSDYDSDSDGIERIRTCRNCGLDGTKKDLLCCGGCRSIWLCSKECQVALWPRHKKACQYLRGFKKRVKDTVTEENVTVRKIFHTWYRKFLGTLDAMLMPHILNQHELEVTHFVFIQINFQPESTTPFRVGIAEIFPLSRIEGSAIHKEMIKYINTLGPPSVQFRHVVRVVDIVDHFQRLDALTIDVLNVQPHWPTTSTFSDCIDAINRGDVLHKKFTR